MTRVEMKIRLVLVSVLFLVSLVYTLDARDFHELARYAPIVAGSIATVLLGAAVVRECVRLWHSRQPESQRVYGRSIEHVEDATDGVTWSVLANASKQVAWFVAFLAGIWLVGLDIAGPLFVGLFLRVDARMSWRFVAISVVGVALVLWFFGSVAGFIWPEGILVSGIFP